MSKERSFITMNFVVKLEPAMMHSGSDWVKVFQQLDLTTSPDDVKELYLEVCSVNIFNND
jgi:hypothetical protein